MKQAAGIIREKTDKITALWKETVQREIEGTAETESLVLLNILPELLKDMALAMERTEYARVSMAPREIEEIVENSLDHGRHRATTANFTAKKIIKEYRILHKIIIMVLKSNRVYNEKTGLILSLIMEAAMEHSIKSFSQSMQDMREKLIATLAHDIRNPLTAANLGIKSMQYEDGEAHFRKIKEMAGRNIRRSIKLVEDLLDAVTVKAGEGMSLTFTSCNFVEEIKLVFEEARNSYSREIELFYEEEDIPGVFDPTAVRRVAENLIINAVKYGEPEKPITISIENEEQRVILRVHNHGKTIASQDRDEIFNFLCRTEDDPNGKLKSWGIGLSFVKMAAEAHGGYVDLESDKEKGTTFSVIFLKNANEQGRKRAVLNLEKG